MSSDAGDAEASPTTTIGKVLVTLATSLTLALMIGAHGVVHAGFGMRDGPQRTVTLAVGQAVVRLTQAVHLDWPWNRLSVVAGHPDQPDVPPLLAVVSSAIDNGPTIAPQASASSTPAAGPTETASMSPAAEVAPQRCRFILGFAKLAEETPDRVGRCTEEEQHQLESGDATQRTTGGLLVWRKADNWTAFTDGSSTWVDGPRGLQQRLNTQRFSWETNPDGLPVVGDAAATPVGAVPTPMPSPTAQPAPIGTPTSTPGPTLRTPNQEQPLRLLVTGDSLTGYVGPLLAEQAAAEGPVRGSVDTHNGTGLTRPDFVDWSEVARRQVAAQDPEAIVVMLGGNDFQNMTVAGGKVLIAGTPAWTQEYQRRAAVCMSIWAQKSSQRVYWVSMPPSRNTMWATIDGQINVALKAAAVRVPGAEFVDIVGLVTDHGTYSDVITTGAGERLLIREPDGVHLNLEGSKIVAQHLLQIIEREWRLMA